MIDYYDKISFAEAKVMQEEFRKRLKFEIADNTTINTIAGADISYNKDSTKMYGAIVVLSYPGLILQSYSLTTAETNFPYKPGYLGFREVPTLLKAWDLLTTKPDIVVLDGQGILHPRRMGIAAHFGVLTGAATIGCAKSSLYGFYEGPGLAKYSASPVFEQELTIGYALRSKDNAKPVYVSPGYGLSLSNSLIIMKKCLGRYRIPEPTRIAHEVVNDFRIGKLKEGWTTVNQIPTLF